MKTINETVSNFFRYSNPLGHSLFYSVTDSVRNWVWDSVSEPVSDSTRSFVWIGVYWHVTAGEFTNEKS